MNKTLCNLPVLLAFKSIERPDVVTNVEDISEVVSVYFPTEFQLNYSLVACIQTNTITLDIKTKANFVYDNFIIYNLPDIISCLLNEVKYILFLIKLNFFWMRDSE